MNLPKDLGRQLQTETQSALTYKEIFKIKKILSPKYSHTITSLLTKCHLSHTSPLMERKAPCLVKWPPKKEVVLRCPIS